MPEPIQPSASQSAFVVKARSLARSAVARNILLLKELWVWPIVAAILLATIGWFLRRAIEDSIREEVASELQTLLEADVTAIRIWMKIQEANAVTAASDRQTAALIATLVDAAAAPGMDQLELLRRPELQALRDELRPTLETQGYRGFVVADRQGMVIASGRNENVGHPAVFGETAAALQRALAGQATVVRPVRSRIMLPDEQGEMKAGLPTMFALAPVRGTDGNPIAVLGLRIAPEQEFVPILNIARPGSTGETYAFDDTGLLISQSRFEDSLREVGLLTEDADSILNLSLRDPGVDLTTGARAAVPRSEQPLTHMAASAVAGESGVDVVGYRDYRGVRVVGAWTWLPEHGFGVATEIDVDEAFRSLQILRGVFFGMLGLLAAAAVAIFVFSVRVARLARSARQARMEARQLGQYALDEKLGEGGMGVVYRAHHALLHRPTAVKFLNLEKTNEQTIRRFEREVQLTSRLNHPNTIAIYDYGRTEEGIFYYAMEYLDGLNLDDLVRTDGPQADGRVVSILRQVCASLTEAHGIGLVHRDIKPANIVLNARGGVYDVVKVLDFGLVKAIDSSKQASLTSTGTLTGTPLYLSPEAIGRPESVDARSDLYAVGAVGYFLLTGTPVFDGGSVLEIVQHHAQTAPQPPSQRLGLPVSADVEALLLQCLAKDPAVRPQSARQLAAELAACAVTIAWNDNDAEHWWRQHRPQAAGFSTVPTGDGRLEVTFLGATAESEE
jgi:eukaryotic-like serine/threonine-protein kinase